MIIMIKSRLIKWMFLFSSFVITRHLVLSYLDYNLRNNNSSDYKDITDFEVIRYISSLKNISISIAPSFKKNSWSNKLIKIKNNCYAIENKNIIIIL